MKKRIKLGIVLLFLAAGIESFAQIVGLKAGLNLSDLRLKDNKETYNDESKLNPGFHVGPTLEFPISDKFSIESGLLLTTKGMKRKKEEEKYEYEQQINLYYLDIPLTAKVYFNRAGSGIYGIFGPYLGIGLRGKSKSEYTGYGETDKHEQDIHFGSDEREDNLKQLDYGLSTGAGIALNAIEIGVTYNLGLANISIVKDEGSKINNRVLEISVGYKFGVIKPIDQRSE